MEHPLTTLQSVPFRKGTLNRIKSCWVLSSKMKERLFSSPSDSVVALSARNWGGGNFPGTMDAIVNKISRKLGSSKDGFNGFSSENC